MNSVKFTSAYKKSIPMAGPLVTLLEILLFIIISVSGLKAQSVGIGTNSPDSSAALEIQSTEKGLLIPRLSESEMNAITNPAVGLVIYHIGESCFYYFNGSAWTKIQPNGSITKLIDADKDTWLELEEFPQYDGIAFGLDSTLFFKMSNGRLEIYNTGLSVFIGEDAGRMDDRTGNANVFIGYESGKLSVDGSYNSYYGTGAGERASGSANCYFGYKSGWSNTGNYNSFFGVQSGTYDSLGSFNVFIGNQSGLRNQGSRNTFVGTYSGNKNTSAENNTFYGYDSGPDNLNGDRNTFIGTQSGFGNMDGSTLTAIGYMAGFDSGSVMNSISLGSFARCSDSNQITIGDINIEEIRGAVAMSTYSDGRFKKNIAEDVPGVEFILKLRPVTYNWDMSLLNNWQGNEMGTSNRENKQYSGFIAQEVEEAAKKVGYKFSAIHKPDGEEGLYTLTYSEFVVPLVKAVQEQQEMIEDLEEENRALQSRLQDIEAKLNQLLYEARNWL